MNTLNNSELAPPYIPVADHDGLIKLADLNEDPIIHFPVWDGARPGDFYQIVVNGNPISERHSLPNPISSRDLSLPIPLYTLEEEGVHAISYLTIGMPAEMRWESQKTFVRIDRTAPGATLLAPFIFPHINFGETLHGLVPGYARMEPGDVIQTLCNDVAGPAHVVIAEDLTERPVRIVFEREFLQGLNSKLIRISYQVTDRAGNRSIFAQPVELTLQTSKDAN